MAEAELKVSPLGHKSEAEQVVWACRLPKQASTAKRAEIKAKTSLENRQAYFDLCSYPITKEIEDAMEQMSLVVTKEHYGNSHTSTGSFSCARCQALLYDSSAKFNGPCIWPSFRAGAQHDSTLCFNRVETYNNYTCPVFEIYCDGCKLFLGHRFEDGRSQGDEHVDARWRHCVLSLSLTFAKEKSK
eukprot:m.235666 g.235666  ORF g.235666 m.235666 type:complete len:187 (-) comp17407_c0_seq5:487-1047(-)